MAETTNGGSLRTISIMLVNDFRSLTVYYNCRCKKIFLTSVLLIVFFSGFSCSAFNDDGSQRKQKGIPLQNTKTISKIVLVLPSDSVRKDHQETHISSPSTIQSLISLWKSAEPINSHKLGPWGNFYLVDSSGKTLMTVGFLPGVDIEHYEFRVNYQYFRVNRRFFFQIINKLNLPKKYFVPENEMAK